MNRKKKTFLLLTILTLIFLSGCGTAKSASSAPKSDPDVLTYGSQDYTAINPALYEHGEINALLFAGLTAHDKENKVIPGLADRWDYNNASRTWTFHLRKGLTFHDGEALTSEDVKFTLQQITDPENHSEIASNYQDIQSISCPDKKTVKIHLKKKNSAFLDYMTIGILPKHLLQGKNLATCGFNIHPVGAGPYRLTEWDQGQSITMKRFDSYYAGKAKIKTIVFKIVPDSASRLLQLESGDIDMAQLTPRDAKNLQDSKSGKDFSVFNMETADYRALAYNFKGCRLFRNYPELSNILSYGIDRNAIIRSVLLGKGQAAYSPIQKNPYNDSHIRRFSYDPDRMENLLKQDGWAKNRNGWYEKDGTELQFTISAMAGDPVRVDMARMCAAQLKEHGVHASVESRKELDWVRQDSCIIGWGSPFDADDHTYKIFTTGAGDNFTGYSDKTVDRTLNAARSTSSTSARKKDYAAFLLAMTKHMPYSFIAYIDADYAVKKGITGITPNTLLGHHGVGIFWNIADWKKKS